MKAICLADLSAIDASTLPPISYVALGPSIGKWQLLMVSGKKAQLQAWATAGGDNLLALAYQADKDATEQQDRWTVLDGPIPPAMRTKLNTWKTANRPAWPNVTAGTSLRDVVKFIASRNLASWNWQDYDVADESGE